MEAPREPRLKTILSLVCVFALAGAVAAGTVPPERVLTDAVDGTSAGNAFAAVQAVTSAENSQLEALMGAHRLALPEALAALGISRSAAVTPALEQAGESDSASLACRVGLYFYPQHEELKSALAAASESSD